MRSPDVIKNSIAAKNKKRELDKRKDFLKWVDACIYNQILSGQNGLRIYDWDNNAGAFFDDLVRELEPLGYTVTRDFNEWTTGLLRKKHHREGFIIITWDKK